MTRADPAPVVRGSWRGPLRNRSARATFLCYHSIAAPGPEILSVSPELFERQLDLLRRRGYKSGTPEILRRICERRAPPGRHVFLSFDDGFRDNLTEALPLLRAYGFVATVFVLPPCVDTGAGLDWDEVAERRARHPEVMRSMDWPMVEAMREAGCEIGSHTLRHPHLTRLGDEALREELVDSRRRIVERLGHCDALAYPFGEWDARVAAAAAAAGYSFGFSLPDEHQLTAGRMSIPRLMIDQRDDALRFALKLRPAVRRLWLSPARAALRGVGARLRRASRA